MSRIACPYCCEVQTFPGSAECRNCHKFVPEPYILASREVPPVYLAAVGFSQHGKTTFIQSMTVTTEEMDKVSSTYIEYLDDFTASALKEIRESVEEKKVAEFTTATGAIHKPLVFSLAHFASEGKIPIVIYDLAGESFGKQDDIELYAAPLKLAHTIWFFVSLHDLEHVKTEFSNIADLFNVYMTGMQRVGGVTRGRNLHVIYTKADKLANILPDSIRNYLRSDPYSDIRQKKVRELRDVRFDPHDYLQKMTQISDELEEFTQDELPRGRAFVRRVLDSGMDLSFSITSSTGRESTRDNTMLEYRGFRVIDPLLWAITHNKPIEGAAATGQSGIRGKEVVLIPDAGNMADVIYNNKMPNHFFAALSELGEVTTYYLGKSRPITETGREPVNSHPDFDMDKKPAALFGSILDQLSDDAMVVVITRQPILDLKDYNEPGWHRRIGFVVFENRVEWPLVERFDHLQNAEEFSKAVVRKFFLNRL